MTIPDTTLDRAVDRVFADIGKPTLVRLFADNGHSAQDLEREIRDQHEQHAFEMFKLAAQLVGAAAEDATCLKDVTIHLENAFSHPLYDENRFDFINRLIDALSIGISDALA